MSDVEQFGELRVEVQLGGGTSKPDIYIHRAKRVEGTYRKGLAYRAWCLLLLIAYRISRF